MEFFLEFFCTIVFSLILSFFISKLLSWDPTGDRAQPHSDSSPREHVIGETTVGDCKIEENLRSFDTEIEKNLRFSNKVAIQEVVDDVEFDIEPVREDLKARSLDLCGDGAEVGVENFREVLVSGVEETLVEESIGDCVNVIEDNLVDESPDRMKFPKIATELAKNVAGDKERLLDDDDDWEGIERTELEKQFGEAVAFVRCRSDLDCMSELGSDFEMQLYALHKVATEGPCRELQPMAFKVSARAKWHAWQKLGNLSPEAAMEQYINLLSQNVAGWLGDESGGDSEQSFSDAGASAKLASDIKNYSS